MNYNSVQNLIYSPMVFCHIRSLAHNDDIYGWSSFCCGRNKHESKMRITHTQWVSELIKICAHSIRNGCKIIHHIWMKQRAFFTISISISSHNQRSGNRIWTFAMNIRKKSNSLWRWWHKTQMPRSVDTSKYAIRFFQTKASQRLNAIRNKGEKKIGNNQSGRIHWKCTKFEGKFYKILWSS